MGPKGLLRFGCPGRQRVRGLLLAACGTGRFDHPGRVELGKTGDVPVVLMIGQLPEITVHVGRDRGT